MVDEHQTVLLLDLADDNPVRMATIERFLPPDRHRDVYRLSDFGAAPSARGSTRRQWRAWMIAIDKMLARVHERDRASDTEPHYYVVGRAAVPVYAYLGMRLSKWAHRITCINRRPNHEWDVLPLFGPSPGAGTFFNKIRGLQGNSGQHARGKLVIYIGTGHDASDRALEEFVRSQDSELAGIVRVQAMGDTHEPTTWLTADNVLDTRDELIQRFTAAKNAHPDHDGLVLFIAGPAPLALLAGMTMNPHYFKPIWLPNYDGSRYQPAVEFPWGRGRVLKLCYATANPCDADRLNLRAEVEAVRGEMASSGNEREFSFQFIYEANIDDIHRAMLEQRPQVLHISGHADRDTIALVREHDGCAQHVPARAFKDLLAATNESFLELVVLNSCQSAAQVKEMTEFVDCAIGMSEEIPDDAARDFSRALYAALARGHTVKNACDQAKSLLAGKYAARGLDANNLIQLYARDGVDPDEITLVEPARHA